LKKRGDILFLCQFFYPEYISSALLPYDTAKALADKGFRVDVLCGYPREYLEGAHIPCREQAEGIGIQRLRYLQLDRSGFLGRLVNYFSFTAMVLLHLGRIANYRCTVVYSNPPVLPWVAAWAKKLFGTKLVFVSYDLYPEVATVTGTLREGHPICRLMKHINRRVFRHADQVVALSQEMADYILAHRDMTKARLRVIPNWYSSPCGSESGNNPFRAAAKGRFTVSYFGNMGTMQDMQTILDAIRELREEPFFFLFAGHGNKLEKLKAAAEREGLQNVAVHAFLHGQDFQNALAASDCALITLEKGATGLCVPSKTYCYMAQGLPLAAVMDESDIVRDIRQGAGVWVRNGEGELLAQRLRELAADPEKTAQMGRVSRALYEKTYTKEICTQKYSDLFCSLLGQPEKGTTQ